MAAALLAACLGGCAPGASATRAESPYTAAEMAEVVLATQPERPTLYLLAPEDADFSAQVENGYLIDTGTVEDGAVCYPVGFEAIEVTILRLKDEDAAKAAASAMQTYIYSRVNAFSGYAPDQAALAEQGVVVLHGRYVALLICENEGAQEAFLSCFAQPPPPLPASPRLKRETPAAAPQGSSAASEAEPESRPAAPSSTPAPTDADAYDPAAILSAWHSGDDSTLTEKGRAILEVCRLALEEVITDGMTDYDKELAVHDWIIRRGDYDWAVNSVDPGAKIEPDHDNPYGLLVKGKAICSGYSSTFQLFMDLLGIECITVHGTANSDREEHAWNMVRLDGEWYCVDVTWDDPYGAREADPAMEHRFFNVTSQFLRDTLHFWDEDTVPECTATKHAYRGATGPAA